MEPKTLDKTTAVETSSMDFELDTCNSDVVRSRANVDDNVKFTSAEGVAPIDG